MLFLANIWGYDLWAPDEPYFAEGAREMIVDGEWIVPHVNGVITTDKPPLFFWLIALMSLPFGQVLPFTARFVSVLAAFGTLALTMSYARRVASAKTAVLAGFVLVTTYMFWEKARWAQIDALLCCLIWVSLTAFLRYRLGDWNGRRAGLVFWGAAGLAVLAKGPVGLLLPLGIALVTLATDRNLGSWRRFAPFAGPALFLLVVGAWVVTTLVAGGDYSVWSALKEHFVERGMHGMHHRQPWHYYLTSLPPALLPWTGLLPGAIYLAWRRRLPADRFLLAAFLFVVLFFSISTEKRELYALPALPAFALLVAGLGARILGWDDKDGVSLSSRWLTIGQSVIGGLLVLAAVALPFAANRVEAVSLSMSVLLAVPIGVGGVATLLAVRAKKLPGVLVAPALGVSVALLVVAFVVYPAFEPVKSARAFSLQISHITQASRDAGHRVLALDLGNLPEPFAFYSDGMYTLEVKDIGLVRAHLEQEAEVFALVRNSDLELLPVLLRERLTIAASTRLSRIDVLLVSNGPAG